jgi:hypothetical protein
MTNQLYRQKYDDYFNFIKSNKLISDENLTNYKTLETEVLLKFLFTQIGQELIRNKSRILYINPKKEGYSLLELNYFIGLPLTIISNDKETHFNLIEIREEFEKVALNRFINKENNEDLNHFNNILYSDGSLIYGNFLKYRLDPFQIIFLGNIKRNIDNNEEEEEEEEDRKYLENLFKHFTKYCYTKSYLIYSNNEKNLTFFIESLNNFNKSGSLAINENQPKRKNSKSKNKKEVEVKPVIEHKEGSKIEKLKTVDLINLPIYFKKSTGKPKPKQYQIFKWPPIGKITLNQWIMIYEKLKFLYPNDPYYDPSFIDTLLREIPYDKTMSTKSLSNYKCIYIQFNKEVKEKHHFFLLLQIIIQFNYIPIILDYNEKEVSQFWYNILTIINVLNISFFNSDINRIKMINENEYKELNRESIKFDEGLCIYFNNSNINSKFKFENNYITLNPIENLIDKKRKKSQSKISVISTKEDDKIYYYFNKFNVNKSSFRTGIFIEIHFHFKTYTTDKNKNSTKIDNKYNDEFFIHHNYKGGDGSKRSQIQNLLHRNINSFLQSNSISKGNELFFKSLNFNDDDDNDQVTKNLFNPIPNNYFIIMEESNSIKEKEEPSINIIYTIPQESHIDIKSFKSKPNIIIPGLADIGKYI